LLEPVADDFRHRFRQHEIPEEHLHKQRDVTEQFDIALPIRTNHTDGLVRMTPTTVPKASAITQRGESRQGPAGPEQQQLRESVGTVRRDLEKMPQFQ